MNINRKILFYNTATRKKEVFCPLREDKIYLYVCGPTVYNNIHVGNARSSVVFDIVYRLLCFIYGKEKIVFIKNITDVDDKIANVMNQEKASYDSVVTCYKNSYYTSLRYLNVLSPNHEPCVNNHIDDIIFAISRLIKKGYAYIKDGDVFFDTSISSSYGYLSGRKDGDNVPGVRIAIDARKKNPRDFALWKSKDDDILCFPSPWGHGRPGWHIECSVMIHQYAEVPIDIHGGGNDLVFPHHENENAQSCALHDIPFLARYWLHNGMIIFEGDKMSKSLGNIVYVNDICDKYPGNLVRTFLMGSHYRKPLVWHEESISHYGNLILLMSNIAYKMKKYYFSHEELQVYVPGDFIDILCDDVNTYGALQYMVCLSRKISLKELPRIENAALTLLSCGYFLGILPCSTWKNDYPVEEIFLLIDERNYARECCDYQKADVIRKELGDKGIIVEDISSKETIWYFSDL